uniref:UBX domain-containing protein n=1 Tax=Steinernema glaseri TaxID=37863 RepID=A0A1I7YFH8_9BILA
MSFFGLLTSENCVEEPLTENTTGSWKMKRPRAMESCASPLAKKIRNDSSNYSNPASSDPAVSLEALSIKDWRGSMSKVKMTFPSGEQHCVSLTDTTTLKALFVIADARGFSQNSYAIYRFPSHIYTIEQSEATLRELGFSSRECVRVIPMNMVQ